MQEMKQETLSMQTKQTLKVLTLGALTYGAYIMQTNEFKYYGLVGGKLQIQAFITMACTVISPSTVHEAKLLLAETVAVESNNGKATDHSDKYGEGLTQFDKPTFEYLKEYYSDNRHLKLIQKIKTYLQVDVLSAEYSDLRKSPMLSIVFARLLYLKVPEKIPASKVGRWSYYKKYFNSVLGATTEGKYMSAMKIAVFQDSNNMVA